MRVPLIARAPGTVRAGVVSDALVSLVDVLPTLAEAPLPADVPLDGRSFAGVLRGRAPKHRDWLFSYFKDGPMMRDRALRPAGRRPAGRHRRRPHVPAAADDPAANAARAKFDRLLKDLPGPSAEQQLRGDVGSDDERRGRRNRRRDAETE